MLFNKKLSFGIVFLFLFTFFSFLVWADTNGIFDDVSDVRAGVFGLDEQEEVTNFTFDVSVFINNNLTSNFITITNQGNKDNEILTKAYIDLVYDSINSCYSEGLLYNGSQCICPSGVSCND